MSWAEMFPDGRGICYEGDDPEGFAAQVKAEYGFDPSTDPMWHTAILNGGYNWGDMEPAEDPLGRSCWFLCPAEHLDEIYSSGRFQVGS